MEKEKLYNLHLRLTASLKDKLEAEASVNGFSSVNSYVNYLIEQHMNKTDEVKLDNLSDSMNDMKKELVDISYYQTFIALLAEMFVASNGNYDQVEYTLNEIDKVFSKSRYRETVGLEKLTEFTDAVKALFTQNASKASTAKPSTVSSSQQTPEPVKQKTIADLEYNEIMIDPESKIPYRRVPQNELTKCKNVPRTLLNQYLEAWKTNPNAVFESSKIIVPGSIVGTEHKLYKSDLDGGYIRVMEDK